MAAAKIALKYFKNELTKEQELRACGRVVSYYTGKDLSLAVDITNIYLNGYLFKKDF